MWWLEILESSHSNYCRSSKKSWKQIVDWKYQKALNGIDVAKISFGIAKTKHYWLALWRNSTIRKLSQNLLVMLSFRCRSLVARCFTGLSLPPPPPKPPSQINVMNLYIRLEIIIFSFNMDIHINAKLWFLGGHGFTHLVFFRAKNYLYEVFKMNFNLIARYKF
jgi:hypothetical protein